MEAEKVAKALETGDFMVQGWKVHFGATPDTYMGRPRSLVTYLPVQTFKGGKSIVMDLVLPEGVEKVN